MATSPTDNTNTGFENGQIVRMSFVSPERRCEVAETLVTRLLDLGLTPQEIIAHICNFTEDTDDDTT